MRSTAALAAACTARERACRSAFQVGSTRSSAAMSTPPKRSASTRSLDRAISTQASSPSLVSMMTWRRIGLAACATSSSCTRTSPGDFTLGSMMAGGGRGDSMIA